MGYYTHYDLVSDDGDVYRHIQDIQAVSGYSDLFCGESCKWYEHENDMLAYSKNNPSVQLTVSGEGEESGDVWVKWFKGGKMQAWKLEINLPKNPPKPWEETP